jgi:hypothetical protein
MNQWYKKALSNLEPMGVSRYVEVHLTGVHSLNLVSLLRQYNWPWLGT